MVRNENNYKIFKKCKCKNIYLLLMSGDRLVSANSQNQQWNLPQNITQSIIYPKNGVGAVITFIQIIVDQVKCYWIFSTIYFFI